MNDKNTTNKSARANLGMLKKINSPTSPSKTKSSTANGKQSKDSVKLPPLSSPPASPTKKSKESAVTSTSLPNSVNNAAKSPISPGKRDLKSKQIQNLTAPQTTLAPALEYSILEESELAPVEISEQSSPTMATLEESMAIPSDAFNEKNSLVISINSETDIETAAVEAEAEERRKERGNGMVKLIYEQYDEQFPIVDGSTSQASIDEVYCLSFVMHNCLVHLSRHPNSERFERENAGQFDSLVRENPPGIYHDLEKDETYYVVVEQEADQLRRDQEAAKAQWAPELKQQKLEKSDGRGFESCSCIYGNPCVDEYGCRDWHSRMAVATANGWKGF